MVARGRREVKGGCLAKCFSMTLGFVASFKTLLVGCTPGLLMTAGVGTLVCRATAPERIALGIINLATALSDPTGAASRLNARGVLDRMD